MFELGYYDQPTITGTIHPVWVKPSLKLCPWFEKCQYKLSTQFHEDAHFAQLCEHGQVSCTFYVEPNGNVSDVTVWRSSAPELLDKAAVNLIKAACPLALPPMELLNKERILVTFNKKGVSLDLDIKSYSLGPDVAFEALKAARQANGQ
ncbi:MAG: energy transducer TonB [Candidatus Obscuribacterales bacterium]|nr:energy transducer TonB [Candidatus Obscuribacterales bacterium]